MAICGIYMIKNKINDKVYIGSSVDILKRWKDHADALNDLLKRKCNDYLHKQWKKYGEENFIFSILEKCDKEDLIIREQYYIDLYDSQNRNKGYNINNAGRSQMSYETRKKISKTMTGIKRSNLVKNKISETRKNNKTCYGASNPMSKLSYDEAKLLLNLVKSGVSFDIILMDHKISKSTLQNIKNGHHWICKEVFDE